MDGGGELEVILACLVGLALLFFLLLGDMVSRENAQVADGA